jgi:DNA repair protein RadC
MPSSPANSWPSLLHWLVCHAPASQTSAASFQKPKPHNWPLRCDSPRFSHNIHVLQEPLDTPEAVYALYGAEMRSCDWEVLAVVLLNTRFGLIKCERISQGTINETVAHPRDIFRPAIIHFAYAFVLIHNHPSGDVAPSDTDLRLTRRVSEVSRFIDIKMLDHVILGTPAEGRSGYFSFKEAGLL